MSVLPLDRSSGGWSSLYPSTYFPFGGRVDQAFLRRYAVGPYPRFVRVGISALSSTFPAGVPTRCLIFPGQPANGL